MTESEYKPKYLSEIYRILNYYCYHIKYVGRKMPMSGQLLYFKESTLFSCVKENDNDYNMEISQFGTMKALKIKAIPL